MEHERLRFAENEARRHAAHGTGIIEHAEDRVVSAFLACGGRGAAEATRRVATSAKRPSRGSSGRTASLSGASLVRAVARIFAIARTCPTFSSDDEPRYRVALPLAPKRATWRLKCSSLRVTTSTRNTRPLTATSSTCAPRSAPKRTGAVAPPKGDASRERERPRSRAPPRGDCARGRTGAGTGGNQRGSSR